MSEAECEAGTATDTSRCWPQIGIGDGLGFAIGLTDIAESFWFFPVTAALGGEDAANKQLAVTRAVGALDSKVVVVNADGILDVYMVTGETRRLNFGGGHHLNSDWDRIYISQSDCVVSP
jgi:hypothetical protein